MNRLPSRVSPLALVLMLLGGFGLGVLADRAGMLPVSAGMPPPSARRTFEPFWEAWRLVELHYVDREAIQPTRMTRGAIAGMLNSLGDIGHTTYLTPEEVDRLAEGLKGEFEGIGARLTVRKKQPTVVEVFPDSPARAGGLKPGDVLLEVDGRPVTGLPLEQVVKQVRGPAGKVVRLRVARGSTGTILDLQVTRGKVEVPIVAWAMLPGTRVAHVALREFGVNADVQLRAAIKAARQHGARGLILDVRGNPGGLKEQAVAVSSEFLQDGDVFIEQDAQGERTAVPVEPGGRVTDLPIVVLIDEGSASSAEIFAGALQDHARGKLVGSRTFGTGTVLQPFALSDGSAVLLAVREWLTPKGRQIWHKGIEPDVAVALPDPADMLLPPEEINLTPAALAQSRDVQLRRALQVLRSEMPAETP